MGKEKFVYNQKTLRYEKIQMPLGTKILRALGIGGAVAAYTFLVMNFSPVFMGASAASSYVQEKELAFVKKKYDELNKQLDVMEDALMNVQERDASLYRQILSMDPIEAGVWKGGKGGSDKHPELANLSEKELIEKAAEKIAQLRHQLAVSVKSQDAIMAMAKKQEDDANSRPSIRPIPKLDRKINLLSGFGYRVHPVYKIRKMHTGIDFGAPTGTPIYATANGKIIRVEHKTTGYGKCVVIEHGGGYQTLYGHMSKIEVKVGQEIRKGEQIGRVGSTGTSTAPHVHYEVIKNGEKINPMPFCLDDLSPQEYKDFVAQASAENQSMSKD